MENNQDFQVLEDYFGFYPLRDGENQSGLHLLAAIAFSNRLGVSILEFPAIS